jgi:hypothetical protein
LLAFVANDNAIVADDNAIVEYDQAISIPDHAISIPDHAISIVDHAISIHTRFRIGRLRGGSGGMILMFNDENYCKFETVNLKL